MKKPHWGRLSMGSACALLAASAILSAKEEQTQSPTVRAFMRAKLASSQRVLEGLVTGDLARVAKGAEEMKEMSQAAQWPRGEDKLYQHFGVEFRRLCDSVLRSVDDKNRDGAELAYLQLTATCIDCHDHVRGRFKVGRDSGGPFRLIPTVPILPQ